MARWLTTLVNSVWKGPNWSNFPKLGCNWHFLKIGYLFDTLAPNWVLYYTFLIRANTFKFIKNPTYPTFTNFFKNSSLHLSRLQILHPHISLILEHFLQFLHSQFKFLFSSPSSTTLCFLTIQGFSSQFLNFLSSPTFIFTRHRHKPNTLKHAILQPSSFSIFLSSCYSPPILSILHSPFGGAQIRIETKSGETMMMPISRIVRHSGAVATSLIGGFAMATASDWRVMWGGCW